jgi:hypothetical protein
MRILYVTRSDAAQLDDDAVDFALGLARMAQHAGHRVAVLVEAQQHDATSLSTTTIQGVTVDRVGIRRESLATMPGRLATQDFDILHVLDMRAGIATWALGARASASVVNVDALPSTDSDDTSGIEKIVQSATLCIAPDAAIAARLRARWPQRSWEVVLPGVDLLAIAAGRNHEPTTGPLRVGWTGGAWPMLEQVLGTMGLQGRSVGDLPAIRQASLHGIDLLCLPAGSSRRHLFEAQAAGLPVLVDKTAAAADTVRGGGAGAVIGSQDSGAWAEALGTWASDAELRANWRRAVQPPPRIEETAFLYESLYRRAVAAD